MRELIRREIARRAMDVVRFVHGLLDSFLIRRRIEREIFIAKGRYVRLRKPLGDSPEEWPEEAKLELYALYEVVETLHRVAGEADR